MGLKDRNKNQYHILHIYLNRLKHIFIATFIHALNNIGCHVAQVLATVRPSRALSALRDGL